MVPWDPFLMFFLLNKRGLWVSGIVHGSTKEKKVPLGSAKHASQTNTKGDQSWGIDLFKTKSWGIDNFAKDNATY